MKIARLLLYTPSNHFTVDRNRSLRLKILLLHKTEDLVQIGNLPISAESNEVAPNNGGGLSETRRSENLKREWEVGISVDDLNWGHSYKYLLIVCVFVRVIYI